jgi:WD40 repeat protein
MNVRLGLLSFGVVLVFRGAASAQATTERVSVDSSGAQGNGHSGLYDPAHNAEIGIAISGDASVVAFASEASNLVAGDTNGKRDVFVHDRGSGSTERVSVDSSGTEGDRNSIFPSSSDDGMWIAFESDADNLVAGDTNGFTDVFLRDRAAGTTERVSVDSSGNQANGGSYSASLSSDGQVIAFESSATNLVANDKNNHYDIFVRDRSTGVTERVSVDSSGGGANGDSYDPTLSADGRFVVFTSFATNLVANDTNGASDVFVHDRVTGVTERVSISTSGSEGNGRSFSGRGPSISADGSVVTFMSLASNFGGGGGSISEVYVHDRSSGVTELVSVIPPDPEFKSDLSWPNYGTALSADGELVSFWNEANYDVFVRDRSAGVTELMSVDSAGNRRNGIWPSISADGQTVAFESIAPDLVPNDTNGFSDVFVHERCTVAASWTNYGQGYPGTNGVPSLVAQSNPVRGQSLTLDVGSSSGTYSFGLLFVGFQEADLPSSWGGHLLVQPILTLALGLGPTGTTVTDVIPDDDRLCGVLVDLQVLESDPGAAKGVSFTPGLELTIGR